MSPHVAPDDAERFAAIAERFVALCDSDARPEPERLRAMRATLAALVAGVEALAPGGYADAVDSAGLRARIASRHPSLGFYNDVTDSVAVGEEVSSTGDAIDDLEDIHRELTAGLALFRAGRTAEAAGHWRAGFDSDWGSHAIGALRAIHDVLQATPN